MTNLVVARAEIMAVVQTLQAAWTDFSLVIEIDNQTVVNQSTQPDPYLKISVVNLNGQQLDLGVDPFSEQRGQILVSACTRAGDGTTVGLSLLDHVGRYFALNDFTTVRCNTFEAVGGKDVKGWWHENGIINYWYTWRKSE